MTMTMPRPTRRQLAVLLIGVLLLAALLLPKLGSLTGGISSAEVLQGGTPPLNSLLRQPFYLPLTLTRIVLFHISHGSVFWLRLANALWGGVAVIAFGGLIHLWFGGRIALFSTILFACSAWTLHVSRLATNDVLYLAALPLLLLTNTLLHRYAKRGLVVWAVLFSWSMLLFLPGLVWLLAANLLLQAKILRAIWRHYDTWWQRSNGLLAVLPMALLGWALGHGYRKYWLGSPAHFDSGMFPKHLGGVVVHLFIRGPEYPQLWLGRLPLLDLFTLVCCVLGMYFYARNLQSYRSRLLLALAVTGTLLVAVGGAVSLSLLVPLLYIGAATGLAYFLRKWLQVFPRNPLARSLGVGMITLAVTASCFYNLRSYYVAWPHNIATRITFQSHL